MAQNTAFLTYDTGSNHEDLTDILTNISPTDTPFYSGVSRTKAKARLHEWVTESLAAAGDNAQIEGADYSFTKPTDRTRVNNDTQIFLKTWEVSGSQEASDPAGVGSEFGHRMNNKMKEIVNDIEYALINGSGNSGASGTARELKGVVDFIETNVESGSGSGSEALTETMYNDLLQTVWTTGGNPDWTLANGYQKRQITAFSAANVRNVDASSKKLTNTVDVYESDFGLQVITLERYLPTDTIVALQKDKWAVADLRPVKQTQEVAYTSDSMKGAIVGELTLQARNEKASGKITELATA